VPLAPRTVNRLFFLAWLLIIGISVHDGYLVLLYRWSIGSFEQNPLGRLLLAAGGGDIWLLLIVKALGTACVSSILLLIYWSRPFLGCTICFAIAALQLLLLLFLYLA
jgi:hypothetical protein